MIRLFVSDLDGTLFDETHYPNQIVYDAVSMVLENDCCFSIATGRGKYNSDGYNKDLKAMGIYSIVCNGALIIDKEGNRMYGRPVRKEVVKDLLTTFPDIGFSLQTEDYVYIYRHKEEYIARTVNKANKVNSRKSAEEVLSHVKFIDEYEEMEGVEVFKINITEKNIGDDSDDFLKYLENHRNTIVNASSFPGYYELTDAQATKKTAVEALADALNVPYEEVQVYGDTNNDLDMLQGFEHSYCPANAWDEVKSVVKEVLGPNTENSVPRHIMETIQKERKM